MWYVLPDFGAIVNQLGKEVMKDDGYILIANQPLYKPGEQNYGNDFISTIEGMLRLIDLRVVEMIELNRLTNYTVTVLFKK